MSGPRHTNVEERLAIVLYDATTGMHSGVAWEDCIGQGLWLADAARILGEYQQGFLAETRCRHGYGPGDHHWESGWCMREERDEGES